MRRLLGKILGYESLYKVLNEHIGLLKKVNGNYERTIKRYHDENNSLLAELQEVKKQNEKLTEENQQVKGENESYRQAFYSEH